MFGGGVSLNLELKATSYSVNVPAKPDFDRDFEEFVNEGVDRSSSTKPRLML